MWERREKGWEKQRGELQQQVTATAQVRAVGGGGGAEGSADPDHGQHVLHLQAAAVELHLVCGEGKPPTPDSELLAAAILWESRKNGDSFRKLQYSRAHSQWKCPWGTLMKVRKALSTPVSRRSIFRRTRTMTFLGPHAICGRNCRYFHPAPKRFPATVHGDPVHTACFLAQVMWHRDGPTFLTENVWVGISFDGTKLWQASFVHFAVGDLGSHRPLGSWILLRGSEKKAIISQLAEVYDLNADLTEVAQQQIPDNGGYLRKVISFFIADTKAQVILGGCSSFTAKNPAATVCWLCGKNRATILHEFGCGMRVIVEDWLWAGMICLIVRPPQRPPDYGLHGVQRQVHNGLSALVNSLHTVHRWKRGKAVRWVQWFLDPILIQARAATGVALEEERKDKKKVPLKIEQTAAAEWVKSEGWDTMCDHVEGEGLL